MARGGATGVRDHQGMKTLFEGVERTLSNNEKGSFDVDTLVSLLREVIVLTPEKAGGLLADASPAVCLVDGCGTHIHQDVTRAFKRGHVLIALCCPTESPPRGAFGEFQRCGCASMYICVAAIKINQIRYAFIYCVHARPRAAAPERTPTGALARARARAARGG